MKIQEIYAFMDGIAPFSTQETWDNSGLLVGSPEDAVHHVMVTLDISCEAVEEARRQECDLLIAHHPVIFSPLRNLSRQHPVYLLAKYGIDALCSHTPLDFALLNDWLIQQLHLPVTGETESLSCGKIITLADAIPMDTIAAMAKQALGCEVVRYTGTGIVRRLGICSGAGASLLEEFSGHCEALLTGDVKHDRWYKAQELQMGLLDCGHYHTEILMVSGIAGKLRAAFPALRITEYAGDPVRYQ